MSRRGFLKLLEAAATPVKVPYTRTIRRTIRRAYSLHSAGPRVARRVSPFFTRLASESTHRLYGTGDGQDALVDTVLRKALDGQDNQVAGISIPNFNMAVAESLATSIFTGDLAKLPIAEELRDNQFAGEVVSTSADQEALVKLTREDVLCSPIFNKNLKEYFQQNFV